MCRERDNGSGWMPRAPPQRQPESVPPDRPGCAAERDRAAACPPVLRPVRARPPRPQQLRRRRVPGLQSALAQTSRRVCNEIPVSIQIN